MSQSMLKMMLLILIAICLMLILGVELSSLAYQTELANDCYVYKHLGVVYWVLDMPIQAPVFCGE